MMFKKNKYIYFILGWSSLMIQFSCNKELDLESTHFVKEEQQWRSTSDARAGLIGIYSLTRAALADNHTHWVMGELRHGDFAAYNKSYFKAITQDNLTASYPLLNSITNWRRFYAIVNSASIFIERAAPIVDLDKTYTATNLKLDIAQARALRAFAYFYMVRIWGDVPLLKASYDNGEFPEIRQATSKQVLDYAEDELLMAIKDLPFIYGISPTTYYQMESTYWQGALLNKISAYAILAHITAWKGEYMKTEAYTDYIMKNYSQAGITYSSTAEVSSSSQGGVFYGNNPKQIVGFSFRDSYNESTTNGHLENLTLAKPFTTNLYPQIYVHKDTISSIFNELDNKDERFGIDTISGLYRTNYFTDFNGAVPIFSKIKVQSNASDQYKLPLYSSAIVFTRLEEIALLRAEALTVLKQDDDAITLLNIVRANRKLAVYLASSPKGLLQAIFEERRRELLGEGWRWYDQIRFNRLVSVNPKIKELIDQGGIYWPISNDVLTNNSTIIQNAYWK